MGRLFGRSTFCSLVACALAFAAQAADFEIRYAEPVSISLPVGGGLSGVQKTAAPSTTSFRAYGKTFQLALERNDEILASLPSSRRAQLARYKTYRGAVGGIIGSWVRLTSDGVDLYGAIWDGAELYTISPASAAIPSLSSHQPVAPDGNVIYRLSDVETGLERGFCAADIARGTDPADKSDIFGRLQKDLRAHAMQSLSIPKQVEVALIADAQMSTQLGSGAEFEMISRLNFVDGIFLSQLGVHIVASEIEVYDAQSQPFPNTTVPNQALNEFGSFRVSTPAVASKGIAHLMTGRDLDGDVAGIAYLGGLCQAHDGVSISEGWHPFLISSLIATHEIGHNFGAPHDGDQTHACGAEPQIYIMAPTLNQSQTFSNCSVTQMQTTLATAACVVPVPTPDVTIQDLPASAEVAVGGTVDLTATVVSDGNQPIHNVVVYAYTSSTFVDVTADGATCTVQPPSNANCTYAVLVPGETHAMHLKARGSSAGMNSVSVSATSVEDKDGTNNSKMTQLSVYSPGQTTISVTPSTVSGYAHRTIGYTVNVASTGREALDASTVVVSTTALILTSTTATNGSCTINIDVATCTFGPIPVGESRQIAMEGVASRAQLGSGYVTATASNLVDPSRANFSFPIQIRALQDVAAWIDVGSPVQQIDQPVPITLTASSIGIETVTSAHLSIYIPAGVVVDSVTASQGTCSSTPPDVSCDVGDIAPGATVTETVVVHATTVSYASFSGAVSAAINDDFSNDFSDRSVSFRYGVDVGVEPGIHGYAAEQIPGTVVAQFRSLGAQAASQAQLRLEIPAGIAVQSAELSDRTPCVIGSQVVTCTANSIATDTIVAMVLSVVVAQPGEYTLTAIANAPGDPNAANDDGVVLLSVRPYINPRITTSTSSASMTVGGTADVAFTIVSDTRDAQNVSLQIRAEETAFAIEAVTPNPPGCSISNGTFSCALGTLPADTPMTFTATIRGVRRGDGAIYASIQAGADENFQDDHATAQMSARNHGDAAIAFSGANASGGAGQWVNLPSLTVSASTAVDDVSIELDSHSDTLVLNVPNSGVPQFACTVQTSSKVTCYLPSALSSDAPQTLGVQIQASGPTSATVTARVVSVNDTNGSNNEASISVVISAGSNSPSRSSKGGGGGGASDLLLLASLALLYARRRLPDRKDAQGRAGEEER